MFTFEWGCVIPLGCLDPATLSLQCEDVIVKFLPPNTTSIVQ